MSLACMLGSAFALYSCGEESVCVAGGKKPLGVHGAHLARGSVLTLTPTVVDICRNTQNLFKVLETHKNT